MDGWDNDTICFKFLKPADPGWHEPGRWLRTDLRPAHTGYMMSVFADGSVHTISYSVSAATWKSLCSRNDGQVLGDY